MSLDGTWKLSPLEFHPGELPKSFGQDNAPAAVDFSGGARWQDVAVPGDWFGIFWDRLKDEVPRRKPHFITAWYRKTIDVPADLPPGRFLLEFDAVDYEAVAFVNGKRVGEHRGMWTPFAFDVTEQLRPGQQNLIAVRVMMDVKGFGGGLPHVGGYRRSRIPQFHLGGIHQSARIRLVPDTYVERLFINPRVSQKTIDLKFDLINRAAGGGRNVRVEAAFIPWSADGADSQPAAIHDCGEHAIPARQGSLRVTIPADKLALWDLDNPNLYLLRLTLREGETIIDQIDERFGYREFVARDKYFYLNDQLIYPFGECRVWVDMMDRGGQGTPEYLRNYVRELKANGYNFLREHAGPFPMWFADICDEEGFLSMPEWGHGTNFNFEEDFAEMREWIFSRYNHPSIAMWSLMNESTDYVRQARSYRECRPLDESGRPMTATAGGDLFQPPIVNDNDIYDIHCYFGVGGYPTSFMPASYQWLHDRVAKFRGKVDKPFIITEANLFLGGDINIAKLDEEFSISFDEYLSRVKTLGGSDPEKQIKQIPLASIEPTREQTLWQASQVVKKLVEDARIRDDLMQGVIPWQSYISQGKHNFQPAFIGTDLNYHNKAEFAGKPHTFTVHLRNYDPKPHAQATVELWVQDLNGNEILRGKPLALGDIKLGDRRDEPYTWEIPASVPTGDYLLRLKLTAAAGDVSNNLYELFIVGADDQKPEIEPRGGVAVLKPRGLNGPSGVNVPQILQQLDVQHEVLDNLAQLDRYATLIIPAYYGDKELIREPMPGSAMVIQFAEEVHEFQRLTDRPPRTWAQVYPELARDRQKLSDWIAAGGRVLCFEQFIEDSFPWQTNLRTIDSGFNTFVDPVRRDHPALTSFMIRDFADWEGEKGVVVDYSISPLNANLLLAVSTYGYAGNAGGMAMAAAETRIGKGLSVLSQVNAVRRYGQDSIATHYVNQLIKYVVAEEPWEGVRSEPSIGQGQKPAADHFPPDYDPSFAGGDQWLAQSFVAREIDSITRVELELWRNLDPRGDLIVELRADDRGKPGPKPLASATIKRDDLERRNGYPDWNNPFLSIDLPLADVDRKRAYWIVARSPGKYEFPAAYGWIRSKQKGDYPHGTAMVSGDAGKIWQKIGQADFGFRVYGMSNEFLPAWKINASKLSPIDLRAYVNTSFTDDTPDDNLGGWTDQGDNDLRHVPLGDVAWEGIPLHIIDPASNEQRSCVVLAGQGRDELPREVVGIPVNQSAKSLFFLHTAAWEYASGSFYTVHFADGTTERVAIEGEHNIADWWKPRDLPAAQLAWKGHHPVSSAEVGLYLMQWVNPRPETKIKSIDFVKENDSGGIPILLAITLEKP